jgi:hypothetical protein
MGDPTRPTQPLGGQQPIPPRTVAQRETVVASDPGLLEEVRRVRFWSVFAAAVAVVASILALIALVVAIGNDNNGNNGSNNATNAGASAAALSALRGDVSNLRSDVSQANTAARDASSTVNSLQARVRKLEQSQQTQADVQGQHDSIKQDLSDLSNRVDQVEKAQEQAAAGGP